MGVNLEANGGAHLDFKVAVRHVAGFVVEVTSVENQRQIQVT